MRDTRISKMFSSLSGRPAFVAYVTAGDPDFDVCVAVVDRLVAAGVDLLELGIPFSDPLADGEANQLSAQRALAAGMTPDRAVELLAKVRKRHPTLPIVFYTYLNPVLCARDFDAYCAACSKAGLDAMLLLDLPPWGDEQVAATLAAHGLGLVSLVAPTTTEERTSGIAARATAFVYYICQEGVTGERRDFATGVEEKVAAIRSRALVPVVVGFGISRPEHVAAAAAAGADGVVVGSAIVRRIESLSKGECGLDAVEAFVRSLTSALPGHPPESSSLR